MTVVIEEDWTKVVTNKPTRTARKRLVVTDEIALRMSPPESICRLSDRYFMPRIKMPRPPMAV